MQWSGAYDSKTRKFILWPEREPRGKGEQAAESSFPLTWVRRNGNNKKDPLSKTWEIIRHENGIR
jgi:hypothetical protein